MDSIFLLVPIVIFFVACAVKLFFWAVNSGQYDDLETEGRRILFEDDLVPDKQAAAEEATMREPEQVPTEERKPD